MDGADGGLSPASFTARTENRWTVPGSSADDSRHWLFYSGNWFNGPSYGLGVARCEGPAGPCRKLSPSPLLASHARDGGVRPLAVAPVRFGDDGPVLDVGRRRGG